MITNNDIKKSSENFYIHQNELLNDIIVATDKKAIRLPYHPIRRLTALLLTLSVVLCGCVTAYAVSPQFRNYLNLWFMNDNKQQDTVPDGYTGIYTIAELNNIRNDLSGKYILMNDLTFTDGNFAEGGAYAGGWIALGDEDEPFIGIFDGNGYVINNLKLNTDRAFSGLFGSTSHTATTKSDFSEESRNLHDSNEYEGLIKNLGLNNVKANLVVNKENYGTVEGSYKFIKIGSIAAQGYYIVGCYAENVDIDVTVEDFEFMYTQQALENSSFENYIIDIQVGGLCGSAFIIDSCYTSVDISMINNFTHHDFIFIDKNQNQFNGGDCFNITTSAGRLATNSFVTVTSYANGSVVIDDLESEPNLLFGYDSFIPNLISEETWVKINDALNIVYQENERSVRVFRAYFMKTHLTRDLSDLLYNNSENSKEYYLIDPCTTTLELRRLEEIILKAYNKDDFMNLVKNDGVKDRINYCYVLEDSVSYEQSYFEQFDFENIWVMKDGVPKLQLFQ